MSVDRADLPNLAFASPLHPLQFASGYNRALAAMQEAASSLFPLARSLRVSPIGPSRPYSLYGKATQSATNVSYLLQGSECEFLSRPSLSSAQRFQHEPSSLHM